MTFDMDCIARGWMPAIGDPDLWGWTVVAAYAVAALLCLRAARSGTGRERAFWTGAALLMVALGLNKQLDLQTLLTVTGRCLARAQGWYRDRGAVQLRFIEAVAILAAIATLLAAVLMRRHLARLWPALLGVGAVLAYVTIRAASFHHVDQLLFRPGLLGIKADSVLEMGGIVLIAANAGLRSGRR